MNLAGNDDTINDTCRKKQTKKREITFQTTQHLLCNSTILDPRIGQIPWKKNCLSGTVLARFSRGNRLITFRPSGCTYRKRSIIGRATISDPSSSGASRNRVINHPSNYLNRVVRIKFRRGLIQPTKGLLHAFGEKQMKNRDETWPPSSPLSFILVARSVLIDRPARLDAPRRRNVSPLCVRWPVLR